MKDNDRTAEMTNASAGETAVDLQRAVNANAAEGQEVGAGKLAENAEPEVSASATAEKKPRIYLGPNLPGGRLLQSTVFRGGIPAYLQVVLKDRPDVAVLIVPIEEMSAVQARVLRKGTAEYSAYQAILGKEQ